MSRLTPALLVALGALLAPAAAGATDYCVAPDVTCGGTNVATFQEALDLADDADDADRIFLGAATYTAPTAAGFDYNRPSGPVEIVGAGSSVTTLTAPAGASRVLRLSGGAGSLLSDLEVRLPENVALGASGITLFEAAERVSVTEDPVQANQHWGVLIHGDGRFVDGSVNVPGDMPQRIGVLINSGATAELARSTVVSRTGIQVNAGAVATLDRLQVFSSATSVTAGGAAVTVRASLLRPSGGGAALHAQDQPTASATLTADGVTIVGADGNPGNGVVVSANDPGWSADAVVRNSTITNVVDAWRRLGGAGIPASITFTHTNYDPAKFGLDAGDGTVTPAPGALEPGSNVNADPLFVDAPGGDFQLADGSPLIDAGDPAAPAGLDLDGLDWLLDGNGDGVSRRDLGAFEHPAVAPPPPPPPGGGSSPPAGGGAPPEPPVDAGGTQPPPGGGAAPPEAADTTAPTIRDLRAGRARVRRGRSIDVRLRLDEAATLAVELRRARPGRRQGRSCRRPTRRNARGRRCARYVRVTSLRAAGVPGVNRVRFAGRTRGRGLAAGRYVARVTAIDAAGNRSTRRSVRFTVVGR